MNGGFLDTDRDVDSRQFRKLPVGEYPNSAVDSGRGGDKAGDRIGLDGCQEWGFGPELLLCSWGFGIAGQHRAVRAQQRGGSGWRKLRVELGEIFRRDRNDCDARKAAVDRALAADGKEACVGSPCIEQLADVGTTHEGVVVNLEIVAVRKVHPGHRIDRARDKRLPVRADHPEVAQLRHRLRHGAQPLGNGRLFGADLCVGLVVGDFVEVACREFESFEHLLRVFVHDGEIAVQPVTRVDEMLLIRNDGSRAVERDRQHNRAGEQNAERSRGAAARIAGVVDQSDVSGQLTENIGHRSVAGVRKSAAARTVRGSVREHNQTGRPPAKFHVMNDGPWCDPGTLTRRGRSGI